MKTCNAYEEWNWLSFTLGPLNATVSAKMELHSRSCKECGDWLKFCRKIAAIMDLETAAPPESWIEEAVSQFEIMSRELSNVTKS